MKSTLLLFLAACGTAEPSVSAHIVLPSALALSDLRELTLRAVLQSDVTKLGVTPADLCTRYISRTSLPDLQSYKQSFSFTGGISNGDKSTLDGIPPAPAYVLLAEAADQPENANGIRPADAQVARGCQPDVEVRANTTTQAVACLYAIDASGNPQGPVGVSGCAASR